MPLNYTNTSAFFDKLTFTTYVNTMNKILFINVENADIKIYQTLENGSIIEIIFHEFGHVISAIFSFLYKSGNIISTPRKKNLTFNESGYYVEILLFEKIIKTLTYEEALYILNINNYKKSLKEFRNGFKKKDEKDLCIMGPFKDLNLEKEGIQNNEKGQNFFSISCRPGIKDLYNCYISIPFKNDIKDRNIPLNDLLFFTQFQN